MSNNLQNPWFMIGAAVVGIVSAAGVILTEHYRQERRRHAMARDLARIEGQLSGLKGQLELLQRRQHHQQTASENKRARRHLSKASTNLSTASEDYNSTLELDSSDMEFYDVSDEEVSKASTITPLDTVLKDVDDKLEEDDIDQITSAFVLLENLCFDYPDCVDLLWRIGKAHYKMAREIDGDSRKLEHINKGMETCEQAIKLKSDSGESHKWYALLTGSRTDYVPLRDRIKDSIVFRKHLDIALGLLPDDASLHHSLGRYNMEIAALKWYERKAASALYGDLPECTYKEAIESLMEAERLSEKAWKENKLALAKCYINCNEYSAAVKWLEEAEKIEPINLSDDTDIEIQSLLTKYNGYR